MKSRRKKITPRASSKTRLKKFSRHWLETVKLPDVSLLGASDDDGGLQQYSQMGDQIYNVGSFVQVDGSSSVNTGQASYLSITTGARSAKLRVVSYQGSLQIEAMEDGVTIATWPYASDTSVFLEVQIDRDTGNITFWANGDACVTGPRPWWTGGGQLASFGASAPSGDPLMTTAFMEAGIAYNSPDSWSEAGFNSAIVNSSNPNYAGEDITSTYVRIRDYT